MYALWVVVWVWRWSGGCLEAPPKAAEEQDCWLNPYQTGDGRFGEQSSTMWSGEKTSQQSLVVWQCFAQRGWCLLFPGPGLSRVAGQPRGHCGLRAMTKEQHKPTETLNENGLCRASTGPRHQMIKLKHMGLLAAMACGSIVTVRDPQTLEASMVSILLILRLFIVSPSVLKRWRFANSKVFMRLCRRISRYREMRDSKRNRETISAPACR
ncbi:hypothetical protein K402DRAFT_226867 [Aulographum hederae CBS 113979]|uniref:Secreted protein n=1 Tax=Aulographum hederae CBS 113979 TaxID=1176131 RepID=A0A6G1HAX9_9PEZI|nr:hypothetical protein K402DRAFT_226867 [Aulographum hederae CBS 113979]